MERTRRVRPTERQLQALEVLDLDELIETALRALHALNRRAKEKRDRANHYRRASFAGSVAQEIEKIYALKTRFLGALVCAGRATVETFERTAHLGTMSRPRCGRTWGGGGSICNACGAAADRFAMKERERWFVVEAIGYRFHQPDSSGTDAIRRVAVAVEPHEVAQPAREIPDVGLTIEAQERCIKLAIRRLRKPAPA